MKGGIISCDSHLSILYYLITDFSNLSFKKAKVAWTICGINAFVMMCSGLVIDIGDLYRNYLRSHIRWPVIVGKLFIHHYLPMYGVSIFRGS